MFGDVQEAEGHSTAEQETADHTQWGKEGKLVTVDPARGRRREGEEERGKEERGGGGERGGGERGRRREGERQKSSQRRNVSSFKYLSFVLSFISTSPNWRCKWHGTENLNTVVLE